MPCTLYIRVLREVPENITFLEKLVGSGLTSKSKFKKILNYDFLSVEDYK